MLNDMDFIKTCDVPGPTKEAIRAIILYKSAVTPNDVVVMLAAEPEELHVNLPKEQKK